MEPTQIADRIYRQNEPAFISDQFKIHASGCSKIMGVKGLGDTGKTFCEQWLKHHLYKRRADIKSKYIEKGNFGEEDGFTLLCTERNLGMLYKNKSFFQDDYMCGTPDLIHKGIVYDNKCSWSLDTFPIFDKEFPNKDYWWQLQVYMPLTGCESGALSYTLIDAPVNLVEQAIKWINEPDKIYKAINEMIYTKKYFDAMVDQFCPASEMDYFVEIPESERIKTFEIAKDTGAIELIRGRVTECREYIKGLL